MSLYIRWPFGLSRSLPIVRFAAATGVTESHAAGMFMELCAALALEGPDGSIDRLEPAELCHIMQWTGTPHESPVVTADDFAAVVRDCLTHEGSLLLWDKIAGGVPSVPAQGDDASREDRRPRTSTDRVRAWRERQKGVSGNGDETVSRNVSRNDETVSETRKVVKYLSTDVVSGKPELQQPVTRGRNASRNGHETADETLHETVSPGVSSPESVTLPASGDAADRGFGLVKGAIRGKKA